MTIETHLGTFTATRNANLIDWSWKSTDESRSIGPVAIEHTEITPTSFIEYITFIMSDGRTIGLRNEMGMFVHKLKEKYLEE